MPDTTTVPVTLDVTPEAAAALQDPATRRRIARLVSRTVRPADVGQLFSAMDAVSEEARRRGVTDAILREELAAYNAESRSRPPAA